MMALVAFQLLAVPSKIKANTITYDFTSAHGVNASALSGSSIPTGLNFGSIGAGSGSSLSVSSGKLNITGLHGSSLSSAVNYDSYVEFAVTPTAGYRYTLSSITYDAVFSNYARGFALSSSVGGFGTSLKTNTGSYGDTFSNQTATLSSSTFSGLTGTTTFRFYGWDTGTNSAAFTLDNVKIVATTTAEASLNASIAGAATRVMKNMSNVRAAVSISNDTLTAGSAGTDSLDWTASLSSATGVTLSSSSGSGLNGNANTTIYANIDTSTTGLKGGGTVTITGNNVWRANGTEGATAATLSLGSTAVVAQRTVTGDTLALGRQISGISLADLGSETLTLRSTGDDASNTRVTVAGHQFATTESATVSATGSGNIAANGTFASYAVTGEGLTGEGSYSNVDVGYTATLLSKRIVTADTVVLPGKYLSGATLDGLGNQAVTLRSTGDDNSYTRVTVGGHQFAATETYATSAAATGTIGHSGTFGSYTVTGEGLTGEGTYSNVVVGYTADVIGNAQANNSGSKSSFADALVAIVAPSGSLAGLTSWTTADTNSGVLVTTASILDGAYAGSAAGEVSMAWRTRTTEEITSAGKLLADVVNVNTGSGVLQPFVLQISYDPASLDLKDGVTEQLLAQQGKIYLAWLNSSDLWVNAIHGNLGRNVGFENWQGSWSSANSPLDLGSWGVDTTAHVAWAVVDHNSQFSVGSAVSESSPNFVAVPVPAAVWSGMILLTSVIASHIRKRRLRS